MATAKCSSLSRKLNLHPCSRFPMLLARLGRCVSSINFLHARMHQRATQGFANASGDLGRHTRIYTHAWRMNQPCHSWHHSMHVIYHNGSIDVPCIRCFHSICRHYVMNLLLLALEDQSATQPSPSRPWILACRRSCK